MTPRALRRLFWLLATAMLLACIGIVWLPYSDLLTPPRKEFASEALSADRSGPLQKSSTAGQILTAQDFAQFWQRPLRRPLYDPPPPPPPPPKIVEVPPPRPIAAKLVATMVEPGNSMAMLRLSTGEMVFRKVDEEIGAADVGVIVLTIEEGVISVQRDEQTTRLQVDGKKGM